MILYRPVGLEELRLLYEADMRAFPPRFPDQPFFYPVLNEPYARQIAREWNTTSGTLGGFVTRFSIDDAHAARFARRVVGSRVHEELWVPAGELDEWNGHITGRVQIIGAHFGEGYRGLVPDSPALISGKTAREQLPLLARALPACGASALLEMPGMRPAVFLNVPFWQQRDFAPDGLTEGERDRALDELSRAWALGGPDAMPLGVAA